MLSKSQVIPLFIVFYLINFCGLAEKPIPLFDTVTLGSRPRNKDNFDKPGHYEMVAFLNKNEINPGDSVIVKIYFSGYGVIGASKVYISISKNIFTKDSSYSLTGLGRSETGGLYWGAIRQDYDSVTSTVAGIPGIGKFNPSLWGKPTSYVDFERDSVNIAILTEFSLHNNAPYSFHLMTMKDVEAGSYPITIVYTYFNGQVWLGEQQIVTIKVKNIIERNPGWAWVIGIVGLLLAFVGVIPIVRELGRRVIKAMFKTTDKTPAPTEKPPQPSQPETPKAIPKKKWEK